MSKPHIQIILRSIREGRVGDKVAAWVAAEANNREDFTSELVDLHDWDLPMFSQLVRWANALRTVRT